jgi:hypothetical protein
VSHTIRDLRCLADPQALPPQAHYEVGVLYRVSDGPPPCPACGAARAPFYATREMEAAHRYASMGGVHTFKEFTVDDNVRITSPEGLERYKADRAARAGVTPDQIVLDSRGNVKQRVEELRHRAIDTRRQNGFDERTFADYKRERNRVNHETAQREAAHGRR